MDDRRCSLRNISVTQPFPWSTHREETRQFHDVIDDECGEESSPPALDSTALTKVSDQTQSRDLSAHAQTTTMEPIVHQVGLQ